MGMGGRTFTGPEGLRNWLGRRCVGHALRHHEGYVRRRLAERIENKSHRLLQPHGDGPRIRCLKRVNIGREQLPHGIALPPAREGCHAIFSGDRLTVVPGQTVPQVERTGALVVRDRSVRHLRLGLHSNYRRPSIGINDGVFGVRLDGGRVTLKETTLFGLSLRSPA